MLSVVEVEERQTPGGLKEKTWLLKAISVVEEKTASRKVKQKLTRSSVR
jgi:hypothetical protein